MKNCWKPEKIMNMSVNTGYFNLKNKFLSVKLAVNESASKFTEKDLLRIYSFLFKISMTQNLVIQKYTAKAQHF